MQLFSWKSILFIVVFSCYFIVFFNARTEKNKIIINNIKNVSGLSQNNFTLATLEIKMRRYN
jgi:hypothetical protein